MTSQREMLLRWIDEDRDKLVDFLSRFVQAKSPNPPGDTREATAFVTQFLDAGQLPYRVIAPQGEMPNIVGSFECGSSGRHLVLNGHIDVFPVGDEKWTYGPWSGAIANGRIYGRGVTDMKCGTTASIFTFAYLYRIREQLKGRLTLTVVSDEQTGGAWGTRYLMENHPEVHGDCLLNGEPSSRYTVRFGDRGALWLAITIQTPGAHGAHTHRSPSATKIAANIIGDLETVTSIKASAPASITQAMGAGKEALDKAYGKGASKIVEEVTLNIGIIRGGLKINMIPGKCVMEADIRLPAGVEKEQVMKEVGKILARYPEATVEEINYNPPSWCDPRGEMVKIIQANVKALEGFEPTPIMNIALCDARFWRYRNIPAYVYGPTATGGASYDEYVEIEDFLHVLKTHVLSAYDYLSPG